MKETKVLGFCGRTFCSHVSYCHESAQEVKPHDRKPPQRPHFLTWFHWGLHFCCVNWGGVAHIDGRTFCMIIRARSPVGFKTSISFWILPWHLRFGSFNSETWTWLSSTLSASVNLFSGARSGQTLQSYPKVIFLINSFTIPIGSTLRITFRIRLFLTPLWLEPTNAL